MNYLLSQEEFDALKIRAARGDKSPTAEQLQELCTLVADNVPVKSGWAAGRVWGCVLSKKNEAYCDECLAQKVCPYEYKHWSK